MLKLEKENNDENLYERMKRATNETSSKSKERSSKSKASLLKE